MDNREVVGYVARSAASSSGIGLAKIPSRLVGVVQSGVNVSAEDGIRWMDLNFELGVPQLH
jgi:hypothetical protein